LIATTLYPVSDVAESAGDENDPHDDAREQPGEPEGNLGAGEGAEAEADRGAADDRREQEAAGGRAPHRGLAGRGRLGGAERIGHGDGLEKPDVLWEKSFAGLEP
jgi:hypothetical protein